MYPSISSIPNSIFRGGKIKDADSFQDLLTVRGNERELWRLQKLRNSNPVRGRYGQGTDMESWPDRGSRRIKRATGGEVGRKRAQGYRSNLPLYKAGEADGTRFVVQGAGADRLVSTRTDCDSIVFAENRS
jgi:hypothetical protein